ncbi:fimbrial protein [Jilunia laotingensis]|jgi:hypothetical protein|uniref:fimbrial protein n=1 Tax=Jilunia laotingensis TaxID=2763675 RepID=UPI00223BD020|nr:fimbrial protein [Jilunia laotingensis]
MTMNKKVILIYILSACIAFLIFIMGVVVTLLFGSCTEQSLVYDISDNEATVLVEIATDHDSERIAEYDRDNTRGDDLIEEYKITNAVVLVYNSNKLFEKSGTLNADGELKLTLREGKKYIYVVANPGTSLKGRLTASPTYTQLNDMVSLTEDYNNGNFPTQGLLMTGSLEKAVLTGQENKVTVPLTIRTARVDLYINKGSAAVGNILVESADLVNARTTGYLFQNNNVETRAVIPFSKLNTLLQDVMTEGMLVGTQYTYPVVGVTDIALLIKVTHFEALANGEMYIVRLNDLNTNSAITLKPGYHYKVMITFFRDETGSIDISKYIYKENFFVIGG